MDSGDTAGLDASAKREPDALEMWFARQRRKWWRQWRWIFYAAVVLLFFHLLFEASFLIYAGSAWWRNTAASLAWWPPVEQLLLTKIWSSAWLIPPYIVLGLAILLGTTAAKAIALSPQIALTQKTEHIFQTICRYAKRQLWLYVGALYLIPGVILGVITPCVLLNSSDPVEFWTIFLNYITGVIAVSFLAVEGQACVLRKTAAIPGFTWALILPFLLVMVVAYSRRPILELLMYYRFILPRAGLSTEFWLCVLVLAIVFPLLWRKPPPGFIGTAE